MVWAMFGMSLESHTLPPAVAPSKLVSVVRELPQTESVSDLTAVSKDDNIDSSSIYYIIDFLEDINMVDRTDNQIVISDKVVNALEAEEANIGHCLVRQNRQRGRR